MRPVVIMKSPIEFRLTNCRTWSFCTSSPKHMDVYVAGYNWRLLFCRRSLTGQQWRNKWWPLMPWIQVFSGCLCRKTKISIALITTVSTSISHGSVKGSKKSYCKTIEVEASRFYNWRAGVRYRQIWTLVHLQWPGPWKSAFLKNTVCRFNGLGLAAMSAHTCTCFVYICETKSSMSLIQFLDSWIPHKLSVTQFCT